MTDQLPQFYEGWHHGYQRAQKEITGCPYKIGEELGKQKIINYLRQWVFDKTFAPNIEGLEVKAIGIDEYGYRGAMVELEVLLNDLGKQNDKAD